MLSYNFGNVKNFDSVCLREKKDENGEKFRGLTAETEYLVWKTCVIGISKITKANAKEVHFRIAMYERLFDPKCFCTLDLVKKHIGLETNASNYSRTQFLKNISQHLERDLAN